jgi:hypothetical protein
LRVLVGERAQGRRHERERGGLEGGNPHRADDAAVRRGEVSLSLLRRSHKALGVARECQPRLGQPDPAAASLEQLRAGLALQHPQLLRDGRRAVVERCGDRADRPAITELAQESQAPQVEH